MQTSLPVLTSLSNEEKNRLWAAADKLRGHLDAADYKHVVLGLIFLKYISDAFEEHYAELDARRDEGIDPEDKDEYLAEGIFWVPPDARWSVLRDNARQPTIGTLVDGAMESIEFQTRSCAMSCRRTTRARRSTSAASAS